MTRHDSERGAALVELAMLMPVLLLILTGIAEFGLLFRTYEVTTNAAREGARLAALPGNEENDYLIVRQRVYAYLGDASLPEIRLSTITVAPEAMTIGTLSAAGVRVTIQYPYRPLFLGLAAGLMNGTFAGPITHSSSALMRVQVAAVGP